MMIKLIFSGCAIIALGFIAFHLMITKAGDKKCLKTSSTKIEWDGKPVDLEVIADITDLKG